MFPAAPAKRVISGTMEFDLRRTVGYAMELWLGGLNKRQYLLQQFVILGHALVW